MIADIVLRLVLLFIIIGAVWLFLNTVFDSNFKKYFVRFTSDLVPSPDVSALQAIIGIAKATLIIIFGSFFIVHNYQRNKQ